MITRRAITIMLFIACSVFSAATAFGRGTAPCLPVRAPGVNEGFADLPGYSLGWPTTMTVSTDSQKSVAARGLWAAKIWPIYQQLNYNNQLDAIFYDSRLKVIVFRPYYNQTAAFSQAAQQTVSCGTTGFQVADIDTDYGLVAQLLYQKYGAIDKTVILTGWEADNQIGYLPVSNPWCSSSWPPQSTVDLFTNILEQRQIGVQNARLANAGAALRVFHAVEVRQVPDVPSPSNPSATVIERIVPVMVQHGHPPDFISYSSYVAASKVVTKLNTIASASGLPPDRIFVGERGCTIGAPGSGTAAQRESCFSNHASNTFNWGARLWLVWSYSGTGGYNSFDLVYGPAGPTPGADSPNGFSVIANINNTWKTTYTCP